jgi:hypothetical protein
MDAKETDVGRMDEAEFVREIHQLAATRHLGVYVIATGAGAGIQKWLWEVPGSSSFLVGAQFPYATRETDELLTFKPEAGYASDETALDLAMVAYQHAFAVDTPEIEPVGLGLTASVASVRAHRSEHRVHVACMTRHVTLARTFVLPKGAGVDARLHDGAQADRLAMRMIKAALDYQPGVLPAIQTEWVRECAVADEQAKARFFLRPVFDRGRRKALAEVNGFGKRPLFPGAFNPVHKGHEEMADLITQSGHGEPVFTVCASAPNKLPVSVQDMLERAKGMRHRSALFTDGDPMYIDKARRFPGRGLVIGADAFARLFEPKWGLDTTAVLTEMQHLGTTLLVFDRPVDGQILTAKAVLEKAGLSWCGLDSPLAAIVRPTGGSTPDISSTAVRAGQREAVLDRKQDPDARVWKEPTRVEEVKTSC